GFANMSGGTFAGQIEDFSHRQRGLLARAGDKWFIACTQGTGILGSAASAAYIIASKSGDYVSSAIVTGSDASVKGIASVGNQEKAMMWDNGGVAGYNMIESSATYSTLINPVNRYGAVFSPGGLYGMGASGGIHTPYKTTDGGASWQSVGGVNPVGFDVWESCGDNNRFIFAGGTEIRLTMDFGASYENKAGNLP